MTPLQSDAQVTVTNGKWLIFEPAAVQPETGFILYPGGRVDYRAYAPQAHAIAAQGYLVVIVRSGSAMTTELGVLKISGEVRAMEAQGTDPFLHLVMPRVLGTAVSAFCLTIVFILVAFASGYLFAAWMGKGSRDLLLFADTVSRAVQPKDVFNILAKSLLPALFASASCCIGGLGVTGSFAEIPEATQRALTRSVAGLFVISAAVSLLTYL